VKLPTLSQAVTRLSGLAGLYRRAIHVKYRSP